MGCFGGGRKRNHRQEEAEAQRRRADEAAAAAQWAREQAEKQAREAEARRQVAEAQQRAAIAERQAAEAHANKESERARAAEQRAQQEERRAAAAEQAAAEAEAAAAAAAKDVAELEQIRAAEREKQEELERRYQQEKQRLLDFGLDIENKYNVAILGNSGVGKSTMTNALIGKRPTDPGAAGCSASNQCTMESKPYTHARLPELVFWDIPGGSTKEHPCASYAHDHCLDHFDILILAYNRKSSWSELCDHVASYAKQHNKRLVIAYTDFENTIDNFAFDKDVEDKAEAERRVRIEIDSGLSPARDRHDLALPLYCIESRSLYKRGLLAAKYDGPKLAEQIVRSVAERHPQNITEDQLWSEFREKYRR
eukprot:m.137870 g.137870  ORF g.137870 m.137870 type:complete len:368 (+) comp17009_c1_seq2:1406-2509(+)